MSKRIYIVVGVGAMTQNLAPRLVNAGTGASARLHVTKPMFEVRPATGHEIAEHMSKGIGVEEAGEDAQTTLPLQSPQNPAPVAASAPAAGTDPRVDPDPIPAD